jgi:hypothetical protein
MIWNSKSGNPKSLTAIQDEDFNPDCETLTPPDFGVTMLGASHGFSIVYYLELNIQPNRIRPKRINHWINYLDVW